MTAPSSGPAPGPGRIRLVASDVDGVLTDGTLWYGGEGEVAKGFSVRDGLGIKRLLAAGIQVALVTARNHPAVLRRAQELGIEHVVLGREDKWAALEELCARLGFAPSEVAYVGDDLPDASALSRVGLGIAVADAHASAKAAAQWVLSTAGGAGALREVADALVGSAGFHIVIPSRYGATRLPGKPLRLIAGRPMVAHVWERAQEAGAASVVVATEDERIRDAVVGFGGEAIMTRADHATGTDRLAEVARLRGWPDDAIVVNVQGDEPLMPGAAARRVAEALREHPEAGIATAAVPLRDVGDLFSPNVVKVVCDDRGLARWFSRAPLPWVRGVFNRGVPPELPPDVPFLRHLGIYAYRASILRHLSNAPPNVLERAESLEQLRALALGIGIHVCVLDMEPTHGVDTEDDLARVEQLLRK